ncbi:MAG: shikimate kinase [Flavipsychrobacter sp.]|nr:shikimate kinase [Flavipsychrobacter sp.]
MSLIYLIGMPGAGKSYWAQEVSRQYAIPVVDMDECLEHQEGNTIAAIFEQYGAIGFREKERNVLARIAADNPNAVVACGGGTPCYFNNMDLMLQSGTVIYLRVSIETLIDHLQHEVHLRPMLAGKKDVQAFLTDLLAERAPFYERAHHILNADKVSIANFTQILHHV